MAGDNTSFVPAESAAELERGASPRTQYRFHRRAVSYFQVACPRRIKLRRTAGLASRLLCPNKRTLLLIRGHELRQLRVA
jgi:hypothetical protein